MRISPTFDAVYVFSDSPNRPEITARYDSWLESDYRLRELEPPKLARNEGLPESGVVVYHVPDSPEAVEKLTRLTDHDQARHVLVVITDDPELASQLRRDGVRVLDHPTSEEKFRETVYHAALYLEYAVVVEDLYSVSAELAANGHTASNNGNQLETHCRYLRNRADALVQSFPEQEFIIAFRTIPARPALS